MKKSEMIKQIKEFNDQWSPDSFEPSEDDYWDDLLTALVSLGMLPPPSKECSYFSEWQYCKWEDENK